MGKNKSTKADGVDKTHKTQELEKKAKIPMGANKQGPSSPK